MASTLALSFLVHNEMMWVIESPNKNPGLAYVEFLQSLESDLSGGCTEQDVSMESKDVP